MNAPHAVKRRLLAIIGAASCLALLAGCAGSSTTTATSTSSPTQGGVQEWMTTTPPAKAGVSSFTWGLYYEPVTIDPVYSANYSENEVLSNLCESLQQQTPDYEIRDGLAKATNPSPTRWVYDIDPRAKFWDGQAVSADDVAFSLRRNLDPKIGSYWSFYYRNVASIKVTGAHQVTVELKQPDVIFNKGMATAAGAVIEKAYAIAKGSQLGSPTGGIMGSGPFELVEWRAGDSITIKRNPNYWDPTRAAKSGEVVFRFLTDDNSLANALLSGDVDGTYHAPYSALNQLSSTDAGKLYLGQTLIQFDLCVVNKSGPLSDPRVRNALSMIIDRDAVARTLFSGAAAPSRTLVTWASYGYAKDIFQAAWDKRGNPSVDVAGARALVEEAKPSRAIVFAFPTGAPAYNNQMALLLQDAAKEIGLDIELRSMPIASYFNIWTDPKVQKGIDLTETPWLIDAAEPLIQYVNYLPGVSIWNASQYSNPQATTYIEQALKTADPNARARLVVSAEDVIMSDMPWIPIVQMPNLLFLNRSITGAPAAFVQSYYPWAADVGSP